MNLEPAFAKPVPLPDPNHQPYWDAANRHRLALQKCRTCAKFVNPPGAGCPWCGGAELDWVDIGGQVTGTLHSFIVVHRAFLEGYADEVPYIVALCDVDDASPARVVANLLDVEPDEVQIGMPVEMTWEERAPDVTIPQWRPTGGASRRMDERRLRAERSRGTDTG